MSRPKLSDGLIFEIMAVYTEGIRQGCVYIGAQKEPSGIHCQFGTQCENGVEIIKKEHIGVVGLVLKRIP